MSPSLCAFMLDLRLRRRRALVCVGELSLASASSRLHGRALVGVGELSVTWASSRWCGRALVCVGELLLAWASPRLRGRALVCVGETVECRQWLSTASLVLAVAGATWLFAATRRLLGGRALAKARMCSATWDSVSTAPLAASGSDGQLKHMCADSFMVASILKKSKILPKVKQTKCHVITSCRGWTYTVHMLICMYFTMT